MTLRLGRTACLCLVISLTAARSAARAQAEGTSESDMVQQVRQSRRNLWKVSIEAPETAAKSQGLQRQIARLLATEAKADHKKIEPPPASQPVASAASGPVAAPASQPATAPASQPATRPAKTKAPPSQPDSSKLPTEVLVRLRRLSPEGVARPIMLADSLFLGGYLAEACELYKMAMQRQPAPRQRAWALFQMANCKRMSDPVAALGLYRRVLSEHPDSLWSHLADVQQNLIEWERINRPRQILAALEPAQKDQPSAGEFQSSAQTLPAAGSPQEGE